MKKRCKQQRKYGECPKCHQRKQLTVHHILPKRFFRSDETILICRECHDDLEMMIPVKERLDEVKYYYILDAFLA